MGKVAHDGDPRRQLLIAGRRCVGRGGHRPASEARIRSCARSSACAPRPTNVSFQDGLPVVVTNVHVAFENDNLVNAAAHVCAWTWFCSLGDVHANTAGYGVIAQAFAEQVLL
jgi:hypothetical protein